MNYTKIKPPPTPPRSGLLEQYDAHEVPVAGGFGINAVRRGPVNADVFRPEPPLALFNHTINHAFIFV
jgi:hypothetical protein